MSDLTLVGDELRLDGETVAVLVPGLSHDNSLRGRLEAAIGSAPDANEAIEEAEERAEEAEDALHALRRAVETAVERLRQGEPA
jgi:hypothetical protein